MAETTIEWTATILPDGTKLPGFTFNPWIGCDEASPGCDNCYAKRDFDKRRHIAIWGDAGTRAMTVDGYWTKPLNWNREAEKSGIRRKVFCASLADVFEAWTGPILRRGEVVCRPYLDSENTPEFWNTCDPEDLKTDPQGWSPITMQDVRARLFRLIDATPHLDWLLLTKRPENIVRMWPDDKSRQNVWLGTSVENQEWAEKRIPELIKARHLSPVLFLSCEPLVGHVRLWPVAFKPCPAFDDTIMDPTTGLYECCEKCDYSGVSDDIVIDWVITGGESGPNSRPCEPDWFRSLRDQCAETGTPFHFKQWGEYIPYERSTAPMIESQHGDFIDSHTLPDGLTEHEPVKNWYWPDGLSDTIYHHCGKKAAGRKLDGVEHNGFPSPEIMP